MLVANIISFLDSYFLLLSVMAKEMKAKVMPTMHTPNQLARFHKYPAQNVPSEPPIKYVVMKMVLVDGQDHHIIDYEKRLKWQDTIFAWFAKWLQDDGSWWKEMYGEEKM